MVEPTAPMRAREHVEAVAAERDAFLSTAAHDRKTPLTALKGMAQLLQREVGRSNPTPGVARAGVTGIETAATRMTRPVDALLDVARVQAGRHLELARQPTELVVLVRVMADELQAPITRYVWRAETPRRPMMGA